MKIKHRSHIIEEVCDRLTGEFRGSVRGHVCRFSWHGELVSRCILAKNQIDLAYADRALDKLRRLVDEVENN